MKRKLTRHPGREDPLIVRYGALLRAAVLPVPDALTAWSEWQSQTGSHCVDPTAHSLLPLVYARLRQAASGDLTLDRLRPVYLAAWTENENLFRTLAPPLRKLSELGIDTMLLKGAAVLPFYDFDYGARSMGDVDLLVPRTRVTDALSVLAEFGFRPKGRRQTLSGIVLQIGHAISLVDGAGHCIDLHWRPFSEPLAVEDLGGVWRRSVPIEVAGVRMSSMGPTDLLFYTILHGVRAGGPSSLRWLADAARLLDRDAARIDWEFLATCGERNGLAFLLSRALRTLADLLGASIPDEVVERLESERPASRELATIRFWSRPLRAIGASRRLLVRRAQYRKLCSETGEAPSVTGFVRFLRELWDVPHTALLPVYAVGKGLRWTLWRLRWMGARAIRARKTNST